jgi:hypothetical protein
MDSKKLSASNLASMSAVLYRVHHLSPDMDDPGPIFAGSRHENACVMLRRNHRKTRVMLSFFGVLLSDNIFEKHAEKHSEKHVGEALIIWLVVSKNMCRLKNQLTYLNIFENTI